jgi:nucleotide-binding universal stress UspA family protein
MTIATAAPSVIGVSRTSVARRSSDAPAAFADVLCAVDGSRGSRVAIHQAICLCGSAARIRFVVVHHEVADRSSAEADLSEMRARTALDEAAAVARGSELETSTNLLRGADPSELLLAEANGQDLLVVGCHGGSRSNGMMLGSTAAQLAHQAEVPLLIARRTIDAGSFPQSVLLATDGTEGSWAAARVATRLARARRSELRLVNVPDGRHAQRYREVLKQLAVIEKVTGASARIADSPDHVADRICEAAKARQASLIAIGRRGLSGVKALGSVSDRVVRRAQCSLLVVP